MWLTWANLLTAMRALLALPCAWLAAREQWTLAALLLSLAILSDLLDGPMARRLGQNSALGGLVDHATDAVFVTALLVALSTLGYVPLLLPLLVTASFLQYAADSRSIRGHPLRASWLGRNNGIGYFVLAAAVVYRNALDLDWPSLPLLEGMAWLLVVTSVASMLDRFWAWQRTE